MLTNGVVGLWLAPIGALRGNHEAVDLRDGGKKFDVDGAVANVNGEISTAAPTSWSTWMVRRRIPSWLAMSSSPLRWHCSTPPHGRAEFRNGNRCAAIAGSTCRHRRSRSLTAVRTRAAAPISRVFS
jgi:hypothetical protein